MAEWLRKLIQKCVPPTRRFMNRRINELSEEIQIKIDSINLEEITNEVRNARQVNEELIGDLTNEIRNTVRVNEELIGNLTNLIKDNNRIYNGKYNEIKKELDNIQESLQFLKEQNKSMSQIVKMQNDILELVKKQEDQISDLPRNINNITSEVTMNQKNLIDKYNVQISKMTQLRLVEEENTWANVFHDVIMDSVWLQNKAFAPGRWAAGYQMLYVMYRILDSVKPKKILELGLGQTTRMISQYSGYYHAEHQVVEHDPKWIEFFATTYEVPNNVKFVNLDTIVDKYLDDEAVIMYQGFEEQFRGQKFDFICIDAPLGGKAIKYARIDILKILPECLEADFALLLDDTERIGETNTIKLLQKIFEENGIEYVMKRYEGRKSSAIFTTKKYSFLTSL